MRVYIEYALLDNLFFDWLVLWAADKIVKCRAKRYRLIAGGAVGSVCAVAVALITNKVLSLFLKTVTLFLMTTAAWAGKISLKKYFSAVLSVVAATFLAGGCVIGIFYLFKIDFAFDSALGYSLKVPIGLLGGGAACFAGLIFAVANQIKKAKKITSLNRKILLTFCGQTAELVGMIDSGNTLTDKGVPVCFLCGTATAKKIKAAAAQSISTGKGGLKNLHFVDFCTVSGNGKSAVFEPDEFKVDGKDFKCLVAFGNAKGDDFDILLNASFAEY